MLNFIFTLAGVATAAAGAGRGKTSEYPAQAFPARGVTRVEISGVRGTVRLKGAAGDRYSLRVRHRIVADQDDWGLSVERRGSALVVEVFNTALGREWRPVLKKDRWPVFDIELTGPARPVVVGWRQGAVAVDAWPAAVDVALTNGDVRARGTKSLDVQIAAGNVEVADVAESVTVRGGHGTLSLARIAGDAQVNWFSGAVNLSDLARGVTLTSERAEVRGRGGRGPWNLTLAAGSVALANFVGRLTGRGGDTTWRVGAGTPAEVSIANGNGAVTVALPAAARASVESKAGLIRAPWAITLRDGVRVAEGRVGATVARMLARVFVRTERGPVRLTH